MWGELKSMWAGGRGHDPEGHTALTLAGTAAIACPGRVALGRRKKGGMAEGAATASHSLPWHSTSASVSPHH